MKYEFNQTNYHDFDVISVNKMEPRSYFIPYPSRAEADAVPLLEKRYRSEKVLCLNGYWNFAFYANPADLPEEIHTEKLPFKKIDVPSCWQFRGYDHPFYVNLRYQFPYNPPVIPTTEKVGRVFSWVGKDQGIMPRLKDPGEEYNSVGIYQRIITITEPKKHYVLSFLGVASCMDVYLNGQFIGYSEGSHNTAEFDLTGKLTAGSNELLVVVHRWCTGTYLEDQDMFRNNGIFRDVLLRISEPTDLIEINAVTRYDGTAYALDLSADALSSTSITFTLEGHGLHRQTSITSGVRHAEITFDGLEVTEWSAENPVLYDLYFETPSCCIHERIGFRRVEIKGDVFLVNGSPIKFKGVNHHDTHPKNGYTLTPGDIEKDLQLCKEYNIDTIRTSHYPPDPLLLELADELGIYIVDENDLETHGTFAHQLPPSYNSISHDKKWHPRYLERIQRLYHRDKLHSNTSVIMWSLGNEAGGYANTDAMYDYLKAHSSLPVHYESAIHSSREAYDVGSEMYPTPAMVHEVGEHRRNQKRLNDRPYFLCEYAHAMGVGPGNVEAYWKEIYYYKNLMGGCVWEMLDHAVLHADGHYTYGGDHGEWEHDGNFCVDGLFYPDRTPSTGARIIRFVYRPIRISLISGNTFEFFNTTAFSNASRYTLHFAWNDGTVQDLHIGLAPLSKMALQVDTGKPVNGMCSVIVTVIDNVTSRAVSEEQIILSREFPALPATCPLPDFFTIQDGHVRLKLPDGQVLSETNPYTILFRAATDNDSNLKFQNTMKPYYSQKERIRSVEEIENGVRVTTKVSNRRARFTVVDTYQGTPDGILVTSRLSKLSGGGIVPRFGKCFSLNEAFDHVVYSGRCGESYCDMKDQFPIREVDCHVRDMTEPNIRPQESGNRCDCDRAAVDNGSVRVQFTAIEKPFELGIKPYTDMALTEMTHREEENRTGTYVTIQAFQQGIGTGSCGPETAAEYTFSSDETYEFSFLISVKSL